MPAQPTPSTEVSIIPSVADAPAPTSPGNTLAATSRADVVGILVASSGFLGGGLLLVDLGCVAQGTGCASQVLSLTHGQASDVFADVSPTGTTVAFASDRQSTDQQLGLYTVRIDGAGIRRLTREDGFFVRPTWSPDGTKLAFQVSRGGRSSIGVIATDGGGVTLLPQVAGDMFFPAWSPDGEEIAFLTSDDYPHATSLGLYIADVHTGITRRVGTTADTFQGPPVWSPNGQAILIGTNADGKEGLAVVRTDSSVTTPVGGPDTSAYGWSPDANWILSSYSKDGTWRLRVRSLDGDRAFVIADALPSAPIAIWSPDGKFIAYDSDIDGSSQVYIASPDGSWSEKLTQADTDLYLNDVWTP